MQDAPQPPPTTRLPSPGGDGAVSVSTMSAGQMEEYLASLQEASSRAGASRESVRKGGTSVTQTHNNSVGSASNEHNARTDSGGGGASKRRATPMGGAAKGESPLSDARPVSQRGERGQAEYLAELTGTLEQNQRQKNPSNSTPTAADREDHTNTNNALPNPTSARKGGGPTEHTPLLGDEPQEPKEGSAGGSAPPAEGPIEAGGEGVKGGDAPNQNGEATPSAPGTEQLGLTQANTTELQTEEAQHHPEPIEPHITEEELQMKGNSTTVSDPEIAQPMTEDKPERKMSKTSEIEDPKNTKNMQGEKTQSDPPTEEKQSTTTPHTEAPKNTTDTTPPPAADDSGVPAPPPPPPAAPLASEVKEEDAGSLDDASEKSQDFYNFAASADVVAPVIVQDEEVFPRTGPHSGEQDARTKAVTPSYDDDFSYHTPSSDSQTSSPQREAPNGGNDEKAATSTPPSKELESEAVVPTPADRSEGSAEGPDATSLAQAEEEEELCGVVTQTEQKASSPPLDTGSAQQGVGSSSGSGGNADACHDGQNQTPEVCSSEKALSSDPLAVSTTRSEGAGSRCGDSGSGSGHKAPSPTEQNAVSSSPSTSPSHTSARLEAEVPAGRDLASSGHTSVGQADGKEGRRASETSGMGVEADEGEMCGVSESVAPLQSARNGKDTHTKPASASPSATIPTPPSSKTTTATTPHNEEHAVSPPTTEHTQSTSAGGSSSAKHSNDDGRDSTREDPQEGEMRGVSTSVAPDAVPTTGSTHNTPDEPKQAETTHHTENHAPHNPTQHEGIPAETTPATSSSSSSSNSSTETPQDPFPAGANSVSEHLRDAAPYLDDDEAARLLQILEDDTRLLREGLSEIEAALEAGGSDMGGAARARILQRKQSFERELRKRDNVAAKVHDRHAVYIQRRESTVAPPTPSPPPSPSRSPAGLGARPPPPRRASQLNVAEGVEATPLHHRKSSNVAAVMEAAHQITPRCITPPLDSVRPKTGETSGMREVFASRQSVVLSPSKEVNLQQDAKKKKGQYMAALASMTKRERAALDEEGKLAEKIRKMEIERLKAMARENMEGNTEATAETVTAADVDSLLLDMRGHLQMVTSRNQAAIALLEEKVTEHTLTLEEETLVRSYEAAKILEESRARACPIVPVASFKVQDVKLQRDRLQNERRRSVQETQMRSKLEHIEHQLERVSSTVLEEEDEEGADVAALLKEREEVSTALQRLRENTDASAQHQLATLQRIKQKRNSMFAEDPTEDEDAVTNIRRNFSLGRRPSATRRRSSQDDTINTAQLTRTQQYSFFTSATCKMKIQKQVAFLTGEDLEATVLELTRMKHAVPEIHSMLAENSGRAESSYWENRLQESKLIEEKLTAQKKSCEDRLNHQSALCGLTPLEEKVLLNGKRRNSVLAITAQSASVQKWDTEQLNTALQILERLAAIPDNDVARTPLVEELKTACRQITEPTSTSGDESDTIPPISPDKAMPRPPKGPSITKNVRRMRSAYGTKGSIPERRAKSAKKKPATAPLPSPSPPRQPTPPVEEKKAPEESLWQYIRRYVHAKEGVGEGSFGDNVCKLFAESGWWGSEVWDTSINLPSNMELARIRVPPRAPCPVVPGSMNEGMKDFIYFAGTGRWPKQGLRSKHKTHTLSEELHFLKWVKQGLLDRAAAYQQQRSFSGVPDTVEPPLPIRRGDSVRITFNSDTMSQLCFGTIQGKMRGIIRHVGSTGDVVDIRTPLSDAMSSSTANTATEEEVLIAFTAAIGAPREWMPLSLCERVVGAKPAPDNTTTQQSNLEDVIHDTATSEQTYLTMLVHAYRFDVVKLATADMSISLAQIITLSESASFFFTHFEQSGLALPPLHTRVLSFAVLRGGFNAGNGSGRLSKKHVVDVLETHCEAFGIDIGVPPLVYSEAHHGAVEVGKVLGCLRIVDEMVVESLNRLREFVPLCRETHGNMQSTLASLHEKNPSEVTTQLHATYSSAECAALSTHVGLEDFVQCVVSLCEALHCSRSVAVAPPPNGSDVERHCNVDTLQKMVGNLGNVERIMQGNEAAEAQKRCEALCSARHLSAVKHRSGRDGLNPLRTISRITPYTPSSDPYRVFPPLMDSYLDTLRTYPTKATPITSVGARSLLPPRTNVTGKGFLRIEEQKRKGKKEGRKGAGGGGGGGGAKGEGAVVLLGDDTFLQGADFVAPDWAAVTSGGKGGGGGGEDCGGALRGCTVVSPRLGKGLTAKGPNAAGRRACDFRADEVPDTPAKALAEVFKAFKRQYSAAV